MLKKTFLTLVLSLLIFGNSSAYINNNASKLLKNEITKNNSLKIAKDFLNLSKDYSLGDIEDEKDNYVINFFRYIGDVKVEMDTNIVNIDKKTGEIYMYRKVFTPNLKESYKFIHNEKEVLLYINDIKKLEKIEKVLIEDNEKIIKAWLIVYEGKSGFIESKYLDDIILQEIK